MHVAIEQDGGFVGAVCLEGAEPYCVSNSWLEMLYRLPDGRWVHLYEEPPEPATPTPCGRMLSEAEALQHLRERAEIDYLPRLSQRGWFRRYRLLGGTGGGEAPLPPLSPEALAKDLLSQDPGISNAELARLLGVNRSTVGRWGWLGRYREMQRAAKGNLPRGHRTGSGQVEAWRELMEEDELERYDRGEMG
jgi:hypothetical protein